MVDVFARTAAWAAAAAVVPFAAGRAVYDSAWRASLAERCGEGAWRAIRMQPGRAAWFHAASVGEVGGLLPVLSKYCAALPERQLLVSTTSTTGKARAREAGFDSALLPLDFPPVLNRVIGRIKPKLFVISETELWPNLIFAVRDAAIPLVLINGRISDYSFPKYHRAAAFMRPVLRAFDRILVQSESDRVRFAALGADDYRLIVAGSSKYDREVPYIAPAELDGFANELGIDRGRPCFVAGSVREGEDASVLAAFQSASRTFAGLQLVIAPRHPERFSAVGRLLEQNNVSFNRRSSGPVSRKRDVLLLDTLGELMKVYALADVVFVGGTLVDIGGHNPLEASAYGKPVVVGPYTGNIRDAVDVLEQNGAIFQAKDTDALTDILLRLFGSPEVRRQAGEGGRQAWRSNLGAAEKIVQTLLEYEAA